MEDTALLRFALRLNAIFTVAIGVGAVVFAQELATMLALPDAAFPVLGVGLVGYGLMLAGLSITGRVASLWTVCVTLLDMTWVFGSAVFVIVHAMPSPWVVVATATGVAMCAALQLAGIRRAHFDDGRGHFELARGERAGGARVVGRFGRRSLRRVRGDVAQGGGHLG